MFFKKALFLLLPLCISFTASAVTHEVITLNDGTEVVIYFYNNGKMKKAEEHKPNGDVIIVLCNGDGKIVKKEIRRPNGYYSFIFFEITGQMKSKEEHMPDGRVVKTYYKDNEERIKEVEFLLNGTKKVTAFFGDKKFMTKIYKADRSLEILYFDEEENMVRKESYDQSGNLITKDSL